MFVTVSMCRMSLPWQNDGHQPSHHQCMSPTVYLCYSKRISVSGSGGVYLHPICQLWINHCDKNKLLPSGRAIHVPQISTKIYRGMQRDHPCGNFLIISLRTFRRNRGEFSIWIFPPRFPRESLRILPHGISLIFPSYFPQNLKMQYSDIRRVPVVWKYPCYDWMSLVNLNVHMLRELPSHFNEDLKIPLNIRMDSRFTYSPNFCVDSLHQQPHSPGSPRRIRVILPAGLYLDLHLTQLLVSLCKFFFCRCGEDEKVTIK